MVCIYDGLANIYDRLMTDINYSSYADYIENIFKSNNIKPSLILDLGCGTGSFCLEMSKRGYEMIGVDISVDMLCRAKQKADDDGQDILFLNQNMVEFELYGTVDVIVSLTDSINYITSIKDLKKLFNLVKNYLNPGGLFVFDINSVYKFKNILADNIYYNIQDDLCYIWKNSFDEVKKLCEFDLTFFVKEGDMYKRFDEVHMERAYSIQELKELLEYSKIELIGVFDSLSTCFPEETSERIFFVCGNSIAACEAQPNC